MSLQSFILAKKFNRSVWLLTAMMIFSSDVFAGWKLDLSRRKDQMRKRELEMRQPASAQPVEAGIFDTLFSSAEPMQEVVIINSERGFIPNTLNLRKGRAYKVHIVNVNEGLKNVSFVMDSFSEHHATYYGEVKSFYINPKKEGVYSFVCPETSAQGKLVIFGSGAPMMATDVRMPASE